jgi:hypothetical protein
MQAPETTADADEEARREALDREGGAGLLRAADETGRQTLRRLRFHAEGLDVKLVQGRAAQEPTSPDCAGSCADAPERSREAGGGMRDD